MNQLMYPNEPYENI